MAPIEPGDMQFKASFLWNDLKLAKFWMDISKDTKEKLWARVTKEEEDIVETIRTTELYKNQVNSLD